MLSRLSKACRPGEGRSFPGIESEAGVAEEAAPLRGSRVYGGPGPRWHRSRLDRRVRE
jgi:hypothetical protein